MKIISEAIGRILAGTTIMALLVQPCAAGSSQVSPPGSSAAQRPAIRCFDVTIYYRPPVERLDIWDWGHILLYVRNDETGEAAYFDYFPEGDYSVLGAVDQARIDAHASLTIETTAAQEQAILEGLEKMQQKLPDWKMHLIAILFLGRSSTCVSRSEELLQRGGISLKGRDPREMWADAWQKYSNEYLVWKASQGNRKGRYRPGPGATNPQIGLEYGRDPHGQARRADPTAINNQTMYFKHGRRVK